LASLNVCCNAAEPPRVIELQGLPTRCLCFSPDGSKLAVGGTEDNRAVIQVIDTGNWQPSTTLTLRGITVMAVAFSVDSKLLFAAVDSNIIVVSTPDVRELAQLSRHTDLVFALAVSSDGRYVATSGQDGRVCLWDAKELTHIKDLDRHADSIFALTFDRGSTQLAAVGRNISHLAGLEKGGWKTSFNDSGLSVCFRHRETW
jgi:WD40 repeat protein